MPRLGITIAGGKALMKALDGMMEGIHGEVLEQGMYTLVEQVRDQVRFYAPVHTATLVDDIQTEVLVTAGAVTGGVLSETAYAPYQEYGWAAGIFPNVANIATWAEDHNIDPWALAISLFRTGYEGKYFFERAQEVLEMWADSADVAGFDHLLGRLIGKVWTERHAIRIGRSDI